MKTLTLLSLSLAVALGMPPMERDVAQNDQSPVQGDVIPVQDHVVVEEPAPQAKLDKEPEKAPAVPGDVDKSPVVEAKAEPEKQAIPEVKVELEVKEKPEVKVELEVKEKPEVKVEPEVQKESEVQVEQEVHSEMVHEVETGPVLEVEEKHLGEDGKQTMPDEPAMELEPLSQDVPTEEEMTDNELSNMEQSLRAEFLGPDAGTELEPLTQEGREYIMAEDPVMELEPEMMEEPFVSQPVIQEEPEVELMMEENPYPLQEEDGKATRWNSCPGVVYEGKCYRFFRGPKRAGDAEYFCRTQFRNGQLAAITSNSIHRQVMRMMQLEIGEYTRTWVGGRRDQQTGRFFWLDGSPWSYADWLAGEPNDTAGVEDCVELLAVGNGKFNDMPCWDLRALICSYPL